MRTETPTLVEYSHAVDAILRWFSLPMTRHLVNVYWPAHKDEVEHPSVLEAIKDPDFLRDLFDAWARYAKVSRNLRNFVLANWGELTSKAGLFKRRSPLEAAIRGELTIEKRDVGESEKRKITCVADHSFERWPDDYPKDYLEGYEDHSALKQLKGGDLPDVAEKGKGFCFHWADGRGVCGFRTKKAAIEWLEEGLAEGDGDGPREVVRFWYGEPVMGEKKKKFAVRDSWEGLPTKTLLCEMVKKAAVLEMPYVLPDEPVELPGTGEMIEDMLDMRFERDPRTQGEQGFLRQQMMTEGLVWRTRADPSVWVYVKGGMGAEEQVVRYATAEDVERVIHLPDGWEKVAGVDIVGEDVMKNIVGPSDLRSGKSAVGGEAEVDEQSPLFGINLLGEYGQGEYSWDEIEEALVQYGLDSVKVLGVLKRAIRPVPFTPYMDFGRKDVQDAVRNAGYSEGDAEDVVRRLQTTRASVMTGVAEDVEGDVREALEPVLNRANRRVASIKEAGGAMQVLLDNGATLNVVPTEGALGNFIIEIEGEEFDPMSPGGVEDLVKRVSEDTYTADVAVTDTIPITKGGKKVVKLPGLTVARPRKRRRRFFKRVGESMSRKEKVISLVLRPREVVALEEKPVWSALRESGVIEAKPFKMGEEEFFEVRLDTMRREWGDANVAALLDEVGSVSPSSQQKIQEVADAKDVASEIGNWVKTAVFDYAEAEMQSPSPKTEKLIHAAKLRGTKPTKEWLAEMLHEDPEVVHEIIMLREPIEEVWRELAKRPSDVVSKAAEIHLGGMTEAEVIVPPPRRSLNEMTDEEQDREAEEMLHRYMSEPTSLWLYTDLPITERMAWSYLAADAFKEAPFEGDEVRRFVEALKIVVADPDTFWAQVEEKDAARAAYLREMRWTVETVPLQEVGVYPHFGGFPVEWSSGNVLDTASALASGEEKQERRHRVLEMTDQWMTILKFLPPILVEGGTLRGRDPGMYEQTRWDVDDGNHRLVAAAIGGAREAVCFVGRKPAGESPEGLRSVAKKGKIGEQAEGSSKLAKDILFYADGKDISTTLLLDKVGPSRVVRFVDTLESLFFEDLIDKVGTNEEGDYLWRTSLEGKRHLGEAVQQARKYIIVRKSDGKLIGDVYDSEEAAGDAWNDYPPEEREKYKILPYNSGVGEQETTDPGANLGSMGMPGGNPMMATIGEEEPEPEMPAEAPEAGVTTSSSTWIPGSMFKMHVLDPGTGKGEWVFREVVGHEGEGEKSNLVYKTTEGRVMRMRHEQVDSAMGFGGVIDPEALGVKTTEEPGEEEPVPPTEPAQEQEGSWRRRLPEPPPRWAPGESPEEMRRRRRAQEPPEKEEWDPRWARVLADRASEMSDEMERIQPGKAPEDVVRLVRGILGAPISEELKGTLEMLLSELETAGDWDRELQGKTESALEQASVELRDLSGGTTEQVDPEQEKLERDTRFMQALTKYQRSGDEGDWGEVRREAERALGGAGPEVDRALGAYAAKKEDVVKPVSEKDFKGKKKTVAGREVEEPTHLKSLAKKAGVSLDKALTAWGEAQRDFEKAHPDIKKGSDRYYRGISGYLKARLGLPTKKVS